MKEKEKVLFVSNLDMYVENTIKRLKIFSSQIFFLHLPPTIIIQINRTNTIDLLKIISLQVLNLQGVRTLVCTYVCFELLV